MKAIVTVPVAFLLAAAMQTPASAQKEDCIKNAAGRTVCGADAEAVRVRLRFEEQFREEGDARPEPPAAAVTPTTVSVMTNDSAVDNSELQTRQIDPAPQPEPVLQAQADAQPQSRGRYNSANVRRGGSVYSSYGQKVFVRGGYSFAGHGTGAFSETGPVIAAGYGQPIDLFGDNVSIEGEIVYVSNSDTVDILGIPVENDLWGLTGLISLRWQPPGAIAPYVSAGVGPAYYHAEVSGGGLDASDGDFMLGYSARAGAVASLGDQFSLEAGYRYLGATLSGTVGYHAAEVGLNYEF